MKVDFKAQARELAAGANECCYRSDGYAESLQASLEIALRSTWNAAVEACVNAIDDGDGSLSSMTESIMREVCQEEIRKLKVEPSGKA